MDPATARIPSRSRRQAMDWSLVLVSQGIATTIEQAEGGAWGLLVDADNYARALQTLRQYQIENRHWGWRQEVIRPGLIFDWASLGWVLLVLGFFCLQVRAGLEPLGLMDSAAVAHGQWWRLFTAVWLHADVSHLAFNAAFGFVLLGLAMGQGGTGPALLAAYLAGVGANMAACFLATQPHRSLGASGMVMGGLGLLAAQSLALWRRDPQSRKLILSGLCGGILLLVLLGFGPGSDVVAHVGGFGCGLLLGGVLAFAHRHLKRPSLNVACILAFLILIVLPWYLAMRR